MRAVAALAVILLTALLAATWSTARADQETDLHVSPEEVDVGLNFSGADVTISGTAPEDADIVLMVDGPTIDSVKMMKKGKVMSLFWMTVEQAEVEGMPAFHMILSSESIDNLLSGEEQVRLGVDPASSNILEQAKAVDPDDESPLSEEKRTEFVTGLRDNYIRDGLYTPCVSCHRAEAVPAHAADGSAADGGAAPPSHGIIRVDDGGRWETSIRLPSDAPLGDYTVQAYYVRDGQEVGADSTTFTVEKVGIVDSLGTMAEDNAVVYAAMSLAIAITIGLTIGFVFPRRGSH